MEERPQRLPERKLGDLLNETFAIYGRHFWRLIAVVAVVQLPMSLLALAAGMNIALFISVGIISFVGTSIYYGAGIFAVGQHYLNNEIDISLCYRRAWWRILSIVVLGLIIGLVFVLAVGTAVFVIPAILLLIYLIYSAMAFQVVIFEGHRPIAALKRSLELIRGSWWRVFGITLVYWLVAFGLGILLFMPFLLGVSLTLSDGEPTGLSIVLQFIGGLVVSMGVWPPLFIAFTLLYYDLRVRKEDYDFATLSREMGVVSV